MIVINENGKKENFFDIAKDEKSTREKVALSPRESIDSISFMAGLSFNYRHSRGEAKK